MAHAMIEHVNISVSNPQRSADLMIALFEWDIRWEGPSMSGGYTIHVGSDDHYIALYTNEELKASQTQYKKSQPMNHIGIVVDELGVVADKVKIAGLKPFGHDDYEPGKRFYFFDWNHIEFEIISYK